MISVSLCLSLSLCLSVSLSHVLFDTNMMNYRLYLVFPEVSVSTNDLGKEMAGEFLTS